MNPSFSEDELLLRLKSDDVSSDTTFAEFLAELDTVMSKIRPAMEQSPYSGEHELAQAIAQLERLPESAVGDVVEEHQPKGLTPLAQPVMLGQFELLSELGSGGMGVVYKARHTRLDRLVALKVLPPGRFSSPQLLTRFNREMRAAGKLRHPNIVTAHDAGEVNGTHFLVMEYVDGIDLASVVKHHGPLGIADACELIRQAALGLQHIADHGMVHRDIKPSNLMLARSTQSGEPVQLKILDLGLAVFQSGSVGNAHDITETGQVIGTIDYMAPEQGLETSKKVDVRADLYSLGATLFKLLTGRAPFEDEKYNSTIKRLRALDRELPPSLTTLRSDCPPKLADLVARLLSKSPDDRPSKPMEVAQAIEAFTYGADLTALVQQIESSSLQAETSNLMSNQGTSPLSQSNANLSTIIHAPAVELARNTEFSGRGMSTRLKGLLAGLSAVVVLMALLVLQSNQGTLEIEAPDDLLEKIQISLLRDGASKETEYVVNPGRTEHRIRSGSFVVQLPAEFADQFELLAPNQLVLRRNQRMTVKLVRRDAPQETSPSPADPIQVVKTEIEEPPPLEDWLKGRKILTVAQDGSGQFKTIQAALDAVQVGQVVKVLDQGPYKESLRLKNPPADIGLVTERQTIVEISDWVNNRNENSNFDYREGHQLLNLMGFRLSGFHFTGTTDSLKQPYSALSVEGGARLVIEDCRFQFLDDDKSRNSAVSAVRLNGLGEDRLNPIVVRDCVIDGNLSIQGWPGMVSPPVMILRNFVEPWSPGFGIQVSGQLRRVYVQHNVVRSRQKNTALVVAANASGPTPEVIELAHNTVVGPGTNRIQSVAPAKGLIIRDNVLPVFRLVGGAEGQRDVVKNWQIGGNWYLIRPESIPEKQSSVFRRPDDPLVEFRFLSEDPRDPNFARVAAIPGIAVAGALPLGPAPKEGDWFTRLLERWGDLKAEKPAEPQKMTGPVKIDEPPPLEEWLKGRTILTVAQDGSGQFTTIQAALNALQEGQVVQVLDQGPYREPLNLQYPKHDTGLISSAKTVIELSAWLKSPLGSDFRQGHVITGADGFRLRGFAFQFPAGEATSHGISIEHCSGLTLDDCLVDLPDCGHYGAAVLIANSDTRAILPVCVRDCWIRGHVATASDSEATRILLLRNYFDGAMDEAATIAVGGAFARFSVAYNIFAGKKQDLWFSEVKQQRNFEFVNNTSLARNPITVSRSALGKGRMLIQGNLRVNPGMIAFGEPGTQPPNVNGLDWSTGFNGYPRVLRHGENGYPIDQLPAPDSTDVVGEIAGLNLDASDRNYLRVSLESPLATRGPGGERPAYIGALPPGPAPKEGDWFTKLRERWGDLKPIELAKPTEPKEMNGPIPIDEPPPLEEWLKGRKILTVAQDGSGHFKTIQAALDALQSGQAVKVLDKGPYLERLELRSPPDDIGLFSEVQTRIEFSEFTPVVDSLVQGKGHFVGNANRLRIHGFEFQLPQDPPNQSTLGMEVSGSRAVVFENCAVRRKSSPASSSLTFGWIRGGLDEPTVIRDCYLEQGVQVYSLPPLLESDPSPGTALVTRNYITGEGAGLMAGDVFQHCVIRNNVFAGDLQFPLVHYVVHADWFELSNNTFLTIAPPVVVHSLGAWILHERSLNDRRGEKNPQLVPDRGHAPSGQGAIYNNLHSRPGFLNVTGGAEDEPWTCQIGHNCYPGDGDIPARNALPRETNIIAYPTFYSIIPSERDYARLMPDSAGATSKAGGQWPKFCGALPPGPAPKDGDWFTKLRERWSYSTPTAAE